jgi:AIPR protein
MLTKDFYKLIDKELDTIIERYKTTNSYLKKHSKEPHNQKSYAFMVWFLEFYKQVNGYLSYITDSEGDGSCDLMFPYRNDEGNIETYCIVQSKWKSESNCEKELEAKEVYKALARFEAILNNEKENVNPEVKKRIEDFLTHTRQNKPVKFIFLSLCKKTLSVSDEIRDFQNRHNKTYIEWLDIDQLKRDFIDKKFKKIQPENPFKVHVDLEEEPITLKIARFGKNKKDIIHVEKPFESYVFLVKPKTIFELFDRYGFHLFFKNIRNPLIESEINEIIEKTVANNTPYFWYYNNGITAITNGMDTLGTNAEQLDIDGLQIINGAQTVYSIFHAYQNMSAARRKRLNDEMLITFRLIKSAGDTFNMDVTRFTNSQNPISDRDFHANDAIQIDLQNAFFETKVWYEKREGEFRENPKNILIVPNSVFAMAHVAFVLRRPEHLIENGKTDKDLLFLTQKEDKDGLYDTIFKPSIKAEELLAAYYMTDIAFSDTQGNFVDNNRPRRDIYHILALSYGCLKNHFTRQFGENVSVFKKIIELYEKGQTDILYKALQFSLKFWLENIEGKTTNEKLESLNELLVSSQHFFRLRNDFDTFQIDLNQFFIFKEGDDLPI